MPTPVLRSLAPVLAALIACAFAAPGASAADAPAKAAKTTTPAHKAAPAPVVFSVPDAQPDQVKAAEMV